MPWGPSKIQFKVHANNVKSPSRSRASTATADKDTAADVDNSSTTTSGTITGSGMGFHEGKGVYYRIDGTFDWRSHEIQIIKTPLDRNIKPTVYHGSFAMFPLRIIGEYEHGSFALAKEGKRQSLSMMCIQYDDESVNATSYSTSLCMQQSF